MKKATIKLPSYENQVEQYGEHARTLLQTASMLNLVPGSWNFCATRGNGPNYDNGRMSVPPISFYYKPKDGVGQVHNYTLMGLLPQSRKVYNESVTEQFTLPEFKDRNLKYVLDSLPLNLKHGKISSGSRTKTIIAVSAFNDIGFLERMKKGHECLEGSMQTPNNLRETFSDFEYALTVNPEEAVLYSDEEIPSEIIEEITKSAEKEFTLEELVQERRRILNAVEQEQKDATDGHKGRN